MDFGWYGRRGPGTALPKRRRGYTAPHHRSSPAGGQFYRRHRSTAGYFALRDWRLNSHGRLHGLTSAGAMTVTTMGCLALSPIVGTVMVRRELTFREAYALTADCVIPFVGGWLVNRAFDAHPEWEPKPAKRRR